VRGIARCPNVWGMAKRTITTIELTDDVDGGKAERTIAFGFDGANYEIDLSKKNATAFERALRPYVDAARKVGRANGRRARRGAASQSRDLGAVRAWARANGHAVSDRGRVPAAVLDAYDSAK
jgi:hypothetical protein